MFKISVMYPNGKDARFDFDYYRTTHMELVKKHLASFGLVRTGVDKGLSGGGDAAAPYICIGHLYFGNMDGYDRGIAKAGAALRGDIPNFTNVTPIRLVSEVLD